MQKEHMVIDDAIAFLVEEVWQINLSLGGFLTDEYRSHLERKKKIFELCILTLFDKLKGE